MRAVCQTMVAALVISVSGGPLLAQGTAPTTPAPVAAAGGAALKVAYLNSGQVLEASPGRTEALAQFEKETAPLRTTMQRMSDSLQAMIGEYQKAASQLTPAQRQQREASLSAKQQEYQQRGQELQQSAQARQEELMAPIMEQVNKVIQDLRAEEGYAFIFDSGAQVPFIVSADKNLDITSRVIDRLKTLGPPKLPAPSAATPASATRPAATPAAGPVAAPAGVKRPTRP
jgi:outer membrane protein